MKQENCFNYSHIPNNMLSIVIPVLNEEKYLPLLLEGIKKQNFNEGKEGELSSSASLSSDESSVYEVIIADAGSKDKTLEIAKNFGCKITAGGLPAKGRNEGVKIAQGDILLFMDADNLLPENFLKDLLEEFKKRNLSVASFPIFPKGNWLDKFIYTMYNSWVDLIQNFSVWATNSVLVKKEIFEKIGGFDEEIKIAEDHDFAKRAAKIGKFGFIKTKPVLTSPRRFEKDGRLKTYLKYILVGIHMFFLGPVKKDIFQYQFDYSKKNKK